jgi:hypothetical protein
MPGRPSAAAEKAAKWLAAGIAAGLPRTHPEAARRFGLSLDQTARIWAKLGQPPLARSRPRAPATAP